MKFATRTRQPVTLPGVTAPVRADRRVKALLPRLSPGAIAVVDQPDLDRATAQALLDSGVAAVVNATAFLSGRYPALGPPLLAQGDVTLVEGVGAEVFARLKDGAVVRLHEGSIFVADQEVARGRELTADDVAQELAAARVGMTTQLDSFTHNSSELLRSEQDLLLHGQGLPRVGVSMARRPATVVVEAHDTALELRQIRHYLRDRRTVLIGVDRGADRLLAAGHQPQVVVVDGQAADTDLPGSRVLRAAHDVVVRVDPGAPRALGERVERLGVRVHLIETTLAAEDIALLLAHAGEASVIVGVGMHATLDDFLDRQRGGLTSTWLTRLQVGPRLVDASAVPDLYSGRLRPRHLFLAILVGLIALAAAIAATPVGQEWWDQLAPVLGDWYDRVNGVVR